MADSGTIVDAARAALHREPRLAVHGAEIALSFEDGVLTAEGELDDVASKKRALERIAALPGVTGIVDRLRLRPAQPMGDGEIRELTCAALVQEPALANIALFEIDRGERVPLRAAPEAVRGTIAVRVDDGIVTLEGEVPGLSQKRLAGVLSWWVPGSRDVINGLGVTPEEQDSDEEITEAVRVALEKDPFVDASQIRVHTQNGRVVLDGLVPAESERHMAECDAWYVFGVDGVVNRIDVHP